MRTAAEISGTMLSAPTFESQAFQKTIKGKDMIKYWR